MAERHAYHDAVDSAANLLAMQPPLSDDQQATLHTLIAETIFQQESRRDRPLESNLALLLKHDSQASDLGRARTAADEMRAARVHEWLGATTDAVRAYRALLERNPQPQERRAALKALVSLLEGRPDCVAERAAHLDAVLSDEGIDSPYAWWALQRAVRQALEGRDVKAATEFLRRYGGLFDHADLQGYHDYLWAWVYAHDGRWDESQPLLMAVESWLDRQPRIDAAMDESGYLPALSRALHGEVALGEERPQSALAHFEQALALRPDGDSFVSAVLGRARALDMLERTEAAREALRSLAKGLESGPRSQRLLTARVPIALMSLFDRRRRAGDVENALRYLRLALEITPADNRALRADQLEGIGRMSAAAALIRAPQEVPAAHRDAALALAEAASLIEPHTPRYADLLWESAGQFEKGHELDDARRLFERFLEVSEDEARRPPAMLLLGQSHQVVGRCDEALRWYARLIDEYPKSLDAARARLRSAECQLALGGPSAVQAEATLLELLEDAVLEPANPIFRAALLTLGDALYEQERYGQAIGRLEDFLALFPDDAEQQRVTFALAEAYRRSAYALRESAAAAETRETDLQQARQRLTQAARLFGTLATDAEAEDPAQVELARLALLNRGDCLMELNEPQTLEEALAVYRQAAARFRQTPTALTAQVQIANIFMRQGKHAEAARSVERARWLLRNIPESAFALDQLGQDRAGWERYLSAIAASHLFRDVLVERP